MFAPLKHTGFRSVAAIYAATTFLEWFGSVALMVLVYRETDSTTIAAAMLLCKQVLPGLIVPLVGAWIDRLTVVRALRLGLVVQAAALAAIGFSGFGVLLFPAAVVAGAAGAIVRSSVRVAVARGADGDVLRGRNALLNMTSAVSGLAGPALAAVAVSITAAGPVLVSTAIALMALAMLSALMPSLPVEQTESPVATPEASVAEARRPRGTLVPISWLLGLVGVVTCVFSMDDPALLAYSEVSLGAGVTGYGAIFAVWGIGVTIGSLLFSRLLHWPMLRIYALATVLAGSAYIGLAVSPTIAVACAVAVFGGIGNGMDWIAIVTAVQEAAPRGQEARAARHLEAIGMVGPGVGIVLGGVLADLTSPRLTLLVPGLLALLVLAAGVLALRWREERAARPGTSILFPSLPGGSA